MSIDTVSNANPVGLSGIDFVEFASPDPDALQRLFLDFGFSRVARHVSRAVDLYVQNDITLLLNREPGSWGARHATRHGPSICALGLRVASAEDGKRAALTRGATLVAAADLARGGAPVPALRGIGDSLIYLVERADDPRKWQDLGFVALERPDRVPELDDDPKRPLEARP